jgi:hypothetical protein
MTEKRKEKKKQKEKEKDTGSKNRVVGKRPKVASFRAPPKPYLMTAKCGRKGK